MFHVEAQSRNIVAMLFLALAVADCGGGGGGSTSGGSGTGSPIAAVAAAPGAPSGIPVTQTIDANGGAITSSDGRISITIPPGALAAPTDITIQPITSTAPDGDTSVTNYRLQPDGTTFASPVTLTFNLADDEVDAIDNMFIATQGADGFWYAQPGVTTDATAKAVSVTTTHFSDWAMLQTLTLFMSSTTLHTGASYAFRAMVEVCDSGSPCYTGYYDVVANHGVCSAAAGVVTASGTRCQYTAPASVPSPNPVIVKLRATLGAHVVYAVARAKITDKEEWFGSSDVVEGSTGYTYHAIIDFVQTDSDLSVLDRHFSVNTAMAPVLFATPPASIAPCTIAPLYGMMKADDGGLEVDYTGGSINPIVITTGGKSFWPVTVTCEGHGTPAQLGGVWLAPDQTSASNGKVTFTINMGMLTGTATLYRNY